MGGRAERGLLGLGLASQPADAACSPLRWLLHCLFTGVVCACAGARWLAGDPPRGRRHHDESEDDCCFLVRLTLSRLRTWRRVWELSRIFMYAASVSMMVLSYSFREATCGTGSSEMAVRGETTDTVGGNVRVKRKRHDLRKRLLA